MFDFGPYRDAISALCGSVRVETLAFFGSSVRDDFSDESDFDVLVKFSGNDGLFGRYFDLKEGMEAILGREVDVVMRDAVRNPILAEAIESEKVLFYAA